MLNIIKNQFQKTYIASWALQKDATLIPMLIYFCERGRGTYGPGGGAAKGPTALDKATPVNFLLHAYWNLGGQGSSDVLGRALRLHASWHAVLDAAARVAPVAGTPLDFRAPTPIGARKR